jgi:hypothetical protein
MMWVEGAAFVVGALMVAVSAYLLAVEAMKKAKQSH